MSPPEIAPAPVAIVIEPVESPVPVFMVTEPESPSIELEALILTEPEDNFPVPLDIAIDPPVLSLLEPPSSNIEDPESLAPWPAIEIAPPAPFLELPVEKTIAPLFSTADPVVVLIAPLDAPIRKF